MTPEQFKDARRALGYSQKALADEWSMGDNGGRTIRRWEALEGPQKRPLSPIAAYAMQLMLDAANIERIENV
tara:strand:- start:758 stop:973 length:216 start_codon:yes stop_codon:yes gene_type:complete